MTEMQCRELVGAYAVGALDPPEAARLADHLLSCTRCRHELNEAEETAAFMAAVPPEAFIDEPADPNDAVFLRALHDIRLEAFEQAGPPRQEAPRQEAGPQLRSVPGGRQDEGFPGYSGQKARSHRRRPRAGSASQQRRHLAFAGAAAAAVLVLGGGVLIGSGLGDSDEGGTRTAPVAKQTAATASQTPAEGLGPANFGLEGEDATTKATLDVEVNSADSGYLSLRLDGSNLPAGQDVEIVARDAVGNDKVVDTVKVNAAGVLDETKPVQMSPSDLVTVSLRSTSGQTLVTAKRP
ncbi:anti-sigma factor family protein [Cryptosporangium sp. NPDC048952]|uniref:anti-sigma factor family protein n=1 Tax=Cryptosporangium sp. NPDC048952 TaxID=3363961 RepID=UPI00371D45DE